MFKVSDNQNLYDLIIIGAGPAGISAAIYATRANIKCCIVESGAPGGKMLKTGFIENYPGVLKITGPDLAIQMFNQINELKVPILYQSVISIEKQEDFFILFLTNNKNIFSKSVIVATGTNERHMHIENEEKFLNKGISFCAICDGTLYKGKDVAVVGGGNGAIEESIYLAEIVNKLYLIHRRDEFRADSHVVEQLKKYNNVQFYLSYIPYLVEGVDKVESFTIKSIKDNSLVKLNVSCIFPYIGAIPATKFLTNLNILDSTGYINVNHTMETSIKGLYAAGDCVDKKYRQISTAISDGTIAALNVKEYLQNLKYEKNL